MLTFSVDKLIGASFYAKTDAGVKLEPSKNVDFEYIIGTNDLIGILYSWIDAKPSQGEPIYWMFQAADGSFYYVPHESGIIDSTRFNDQGVLSNEEIKELEEAANQNPFIATATTFFKWALGAWVGVQIVKAVIDRK